MPKCLFKDVGEHLWPRDALLLMNVATGSFSWIQLNDAILWSYWKITTEQDKAWEISINKYSPLLLHIVLLIFIYTQTSSPNLFCPKSPKPTRGIYNSSRISCGVLWICTLKSTWNNKDIKTIFWPWLRRGLTSGIYHFSFCRDLKVYITKIINDIKFPQSDCRTEMGQLPALPSC